MPDIEAKIDAFTTEELATAFFENSVLDAEQNLDGFMLKQSGFFSVYKDEDYQSQLVEGGATFVVISYPKGTAFRIDGGMAAT